MSFKALPKERGFIIPIPWGPSRIPKVKRKTTLGIENLAAIIWEITPAIIITEKIVIRFASIIVIYGKGYRKLSPGSRIHTFNLFGIFIQDISPFLFKGGG